MENANSDCLFLGTLYGESNTFPLSHQPPTPFKLRINSK